MKIELPIQRFVNLTDHGDIVAAYDVQSEDDLVDSSRRREDTFVGLVENHIDRLVETFQDADKVTAVRGDDRDGSVDVGLEAGSHAAMPERGGGECIRYAFI